MNKLVSKKRAITVSALREKSIKQRSLYCKFNNIDTIVMDCGIFFENIYDHNKYIKNLVIDLNNPENFVDINLRNENTIKNISFSNNPMLEGITIPLEVLKERLNFKILVFPDKNEIKKINLLNGENIEEINIDESIYNFQIENIITKGNKKLEIIIRYNNKDEKIILYDSLGNKHISFEKQTIKTDHKLDLRDYNDTTMIAYLNNTLPIEEMIITPEILKNKQFVNFENIIINNLKILDHNEMLLNPNIFELDNVKLDIIKTHSEYKEKISNIMFLETNYHNKVYIYVDENNEIKIVEENKLKEKSNIDKYKFIKEEYSAGVLIKYKKDLKFDLILNNKLFHINKVFINWYLNNVTKYDTKIIPNNFFMFHNRNTNIYDLNIDEYKYISEYLFDNLLDDLTRCTLFDNFNKEYNKYLSYLNHIKYLHNIGYSYKALIYLHMHGFDNITGINNTLGYRNIEDKELIEEFNILGKKLIKRRNKNESK